MFFMKNKIFILLATAAICVSLTGCGGNTQSGGSAGAQGSSAVSAKSVSEKAEAVMSAVSFETYENKEVTMKSVSQSQLKDILGVDDADVDEFAAYICPAGAVPDEFGVFNAKDADAAGRIKEKLDKRVERQRSSFKDYTPKEMYKFDDCFVEANGTTVIYSICADNSKVKELLK